MTPEFSIPYSDLVLIRPVGGSGGGMVYAAWRKSERRHVAVKMLRLPQHVSPAARQRFLREAELVAQLRHPHIVEVHGVGRTPAGEYFQVMELVRGADLATHIAYHPLTAQSAADVVATVADALEYAHQRGVIHRDLKPGNVLLAAGGRIKVTDFCPLIGTPPYMAPEQVHHRWGTVGPRTDVYGLGGLLYTLLLRRPPFPGADPTEVLRRVVSAESPPRLSVLRPGIPETLDRVCMQCLSKDPLDRFASASEVAADLLHRQQFATGYLGGG